MAKVAVVGAGMMGSAMSVPLSDRGHEVHLIGTHLDDHIVSELSRGEPHPTLRHELPRGVVTHPISELAEVVDSSDEVVLGVSSAGVAWAARQLASHLRPGARLLMISKGLHPVDPMPLTLSQAFCAEVPASVAESIDVVAVTGPCIAGELVRREPTCVVFSSSNREAAQHWQSLVTTTYYLPRVGIDTVAEQLCAALKNAYAMGMAFPAGMHERRGGSLGSIAMHNLEAAVFAQAVLEMQRLVELFGADPSGVAGLPGVGDLHVTCNGGRTGRLGKMLGLGLAPEEAVRRMQGATLECLEILEVLQAQLPKFAEHHGLRSNELPLLRHLIAVALESAKADLPLAAFFGE